MSDLYAYELQPPLVLDELNGATVAFGPGGQMLDVKAALDAGGGVIVTDNEHVISTLRQFPALREIPAPEGAEVTELSVELPIEADTQPMLYSPDSATDPNFPAAGAVDPLLPPQVDAAAVHADEPGTPEEAAKQPESQAQAERQGSRSRRRGAEAPQEEGDDDES